MPSRDDAMSLLDVVDQLEEDANGEKVSFESILSSFGRRSFGPLLLVPALLALLPTGAIPGMAIVCGTIILLIAGQFLFGLTSPWLPRRVLDFQFSAATMEKALSKSRKPLRWIDRWIEPRLEFLTEVPWVQVTSLVCVAMAGLMYPLALLPFAVAAPAAAVTLLALGMTTRDGALIVTGYLAGGGSLGMAAWLLL